MTQKVFSGMTATAVLGSATITSTTTSSAVDLAGYDGHMAFVLAAGNATAGTNPTLNVKLQDCATSDGTFEDVTGATYTQVTGSGGGVQKLTMERRKFRRYIKAVATVGGTSTPTFSLSVTALGVTKIV